VALPENLGMASVDVKNEMLMKLRGGGWNRGIYLIRWSLKTAVNQQAKYLHHWGPQQQDLSAMLVLPSSE